MSDTSNLFDFAPIDTSVPYKSVKDNTGPYDGFNIPDFDISLPNYDGLINDTPVDYANGDVFQTLNALNTYTGTIIDETGEPIPWATINSETDSTIYTTADDFGNYNIEVPANHNVKISSVGFQPLIIPASQLTNNIVLKMDSANQLDEIVIVATKPTQTPKNYTPLFITIGVLAIITGAMYVSKPTKKVALAGARKKTSRKPKKRIKKKTNKGLNAGAVEVTI